MAKKSQKTSSQDRQELAKVEAPAPAPQTKAQEDKPEQTSTTPLTAGLDKLACLQTALAKAGQLYLLPEQEKELQAPFPDCVVGIIPVSGYRYIPHTYISRRLNDVIGAGQWAIVRIREWSDDEEGILYGSYALIVRGVWVGETVAGAGIPGGNKKLDWGDALETTRGIALRRIAAKALGVGDQVWLPDNLPTTQRTAKLQEPAKPSGAPSNGQEQQKAPANGNATELFARLKKAAYLGMVALGKEWEAIGKDARVMMSGYKDQLKDIATKYEVEDIPFQ